MPTKITKRGFFSEEALQQSESIKHDHKQLFFHLDDVNEKAHIHRGGFPVGLKQLKPVLTAALFMRALTAYQAMIFLAQKGFASETRATCRNILEAKFRLAYILNQADVASLATANDKTSLRSPTKTTAVSRSGQPAQSLAVSSGISRNTPL
jgi:hypothetical protein